jgi:hypothetical protein
MHGNTIKTITIRLSSEYSYTLSNYNFTNLLKSAEPSLYFQFIRGKGVKIPF